MAPFGNNVVLFGGEALDINGNLVFFGDTWIWDGTNWTQITSFGAFGTGARPPVRSRVVMAYHSLSGKAVLFGGENATGKLNDTWELELVSSPLLHRSYYQWTQSALR